MIFQGKKIYIYIYIELKVCALIFSQILSEIFLTLKYSEMLTNAHSYSYDVPVMLVIF